MTPEGKVKHKVKGILKDHGAYFFMPVQTGYGMPSLDFLCSVYGFFLAVETKAGNEKPTARQEVTIQEIRQSGGFVIVVNEDTRYLETVLSMMRVSFSRIGELMPAAGAQSASSNSQG